MKADEATMFVEVYGTLQVHPWVDLTQLEDDAYSLFTARAVSMGWTSTAGDGPHPVLWGMNDAGQAWGGQSARVAWFQVGMVGPGPLPVQPVLACAGDTTSRVGVLDLNGLTLLLPLAAAGPAVAHLVSGLNWFTPADPMGRTAVHLTVDPGEDDVVGSRAADVLADLRRSNTGPFEVDTVLPSTADVAWEPTAIGDLWLGAGRHPVTFACSVPEWSLDALAWLTARMAEALCSAGVRTAVRVSVARARSDA